MLLVIVISFQGIHFLWMESGIHINCLVTNMEFGAWYQKINGKYFSLLNFSILISEERERRIKVHFQKMKQWELVGFKLCVEIAIEKKCKAIYLHYTPWIWNLSHIRNSMQKQIMATAQLLAFNKLNLSAFYNKMDFLWKKKNPLAFQYNM